MNYCALADTVIERCFRTFLLVLILCCNQQAIGVPNVRIDQLVARSDVIVIADITEIKLVGPTPPIVLRGQLLGAAEYSAKLAIHQFIKGSAPTRIEVKYALPSSFAGYRGLHVGTRIAFLRQTKGDYEIADPYHSDFPAVLSGSGDSSSSQNVQDYAAAVIGEMLNVVSSSAATEQEKSAILGIDYAFPHTRQVIEAFRAGLANAQGPDLRQRLQGELISFGDITEVANAVRLLLANEATPDQRIWLLYVIGNRVTDSRAIGNLRPMLHSANPRLRAVAAQALWNIKSATALRDIAPLLRDVDEQVRFFAVRALSDIADEPSWGGPGEAHFRQHEKEYLNHWEYWLKAQGIE